MKMLIAIIDYVIGVLIYISNGMILLVLVKMKSSKKTTNILFGNLTLSHLTLATAHTAKTICGSLSVSSHSTCVVLLIIIEASALTYMTTVILLYLELYLSMKRMRANKPVFSPKQTVIIILAIWIFWFLVAISSLALLNQETKNEPVTMQLCNLGIYIYEPAYVGLIVSSLSANLVVIFILHVLCYYYTKLYGVTCTGRDNQGQENPDNLVLQGARNRLAKSHKEHLHLLLTIMLVLFVCWGLFILLHYLAAFCTACRPYFTPVVLVGAKILFSIPIFSNSVIYLTKSPVFKTTFKRSFCGCIRSIRSPAIHPVSTVNTQETIELEEM